MADISLVFVKQKVQYLWHFVLRLYKQSKQTKWTQQEDEKSMMAKHENKKQNKKTHLQISSFSTLPDHHDKCNKSNLQQ